jgi:hypothetical protein
MPKAVLLKNVPHATRPRFPKGYGIPKNTDGMLPWSFVEERMAKARNYWLSTTRPDGPPHTRPVDGVWVDGALCFGGAPETRWVRNLQKNPSISVHLGSETEVVILEGSAQFITDAKHPLVGPALEASRAKYPEYHPGSERAEFLHLGSQGKLANGRSRRRRNWRRSSLLGRRVLGHEVDGLVRAVALGLAILLNPLQR